MIKQIDLSQKIIFCVISNLDSDQITFKFVLHCRIDKRNSVAKLKHRFCKTNKGQKTLSYIGRSLQDNLLKTIKKTNNLNTFKHNVKRLYLT